MERPNLGKPFVPAVLNNLPDATVALPINSSYPRVASAMLSTPRQLAPSVGNASKGVTIMGEAMQGVENFVSARSPSTRKESPSLMILAGGRNQIYLNQVMLFQLASLTFLLV